MQTQELTPGIIWQDVRPTPAVKLRTGVPAFLGLTEKAPRDEQNQEAFYLPQAVNQWPRFKELFGSPVDRGYLSCAVRGFFENGGRECYVVPCKNGAALKSALERGLQALEPIDDVDLVCAPDILRGYRNSESADDVLTMQGLVLEHCDARGDRFALLDALPDALDKVVVQRQALDSANGALYYPWVRPRLKEECFVPLRDEDDEDEGEGEGEGEGEDEGEGEGEGEGEDKELFVPPCGHVAGVLARTDRLFGVHKPPANEILEGVLDLEIALTQGDQRELHRHGVNALRSFPGRGIRVWGARTLSSDPSWCYINVRRLVITVGRWIEHHMGDVPFEPNDAHLWARIRRELSAYLDGLYQRGALKGASEEEAFYVQCDAETNPPEERAGGRVVTEIGLAPAVPGEFLVVRIIHGESGLRPEI